MALAPDTVLKDRYRILVELGQGGMGSLYRAYDENLGIYVAVKENLYLSSEFAKQFQQEARILASLKHPALPRVLDYFQIPNQGQYLVMDFIEGDDLRQKIDRQGVIPEKELVTIGAAICDALTYLHSRSPIVVHRDIKPGNIKITPEGEIVLIDFGLAKIVEDSQATITGARAMTPGYSPPEQYGTAHTDERSDIYALGATLYAAATGIIPEDALSRVTGKLTLTPVLQLKPDISRKFANIIEKMLEIDPEKRYQSARDLNRELIAAVKPLEISWENSHLNPLPAVPVTNREADANQLLVNERAKNPSNDADSNDDFGVSIPQRLKQQHRWIPLKAILVSLVLFASGATALAALFPNLFNIGGTPFQQTEPTAFYTQVIIPSNTPIVAPTLTIPPFTPTTEAILPTATSGTTVELPAEPVPTYTPSPTPMGGGSGQISFVSDRTGSNQVWVMNIDGSSQKQLTSMADGTCQPDWSPDGQKLAVISPCKIQQITYRDTKIFILDSNGENPVEMPNTLPGDFDPAWSPDGQRIAFTSYRSGVTHIFVYDYKSNSLQELSDSRFADMHPAWHPVGKQLAFSRLITFFHIFVMSDMGQTQFQFSSMGNLNDYWPKWSSDGDFIVFGRTSAETSIPYIAKLRYEDRTKGAEIKLPPVEKRITPPHSNADLSLDMQWLAYESWPDGRNHDVYLVSMDGNTWLRLTTDPGHDFDPDWLPISVLNQ